MKYCTDSLNDESHLWIACEKAQMESGLSMKTRLGKLITRAPDE